MNWMTAVYSCLLMIWHSYMSFDIVHRDLKGRGLLASFTLDTTACSGPNHINYLEHVQSTINVTYGYRGALVLTLISPMGTHSTLLDRRPRDSHRGSFSSWPFMSTHFWGERASGVWTLEVRNGSPRVSSGEFGSLSFDLLLLLEVREEGYVSLVIIPTLGLKLYKH